MKTSLTALTLLFAISGCMKDEPRISQQRICSTDAEAERLASFVIRCAEAANPHSDEEGEDLVRECRTTGQEILCPLIESVWNEKAYRWEPKPSYGPQQK